MSWTYSGDPSTSPIDEARFLLGDTTQTAQSLSDSELNYLLNLQDPANTYFAAADAANLMAGRYIRMSATSKKVGDLTLSNDYGASAGRYKELAAVLMLGRSKFRVGVPFMADDLPKQFEIGIHDQFKDFPFAQKDGYYA